MNTTQKIIVLEQVSAIARINDALFPVMKQVSQEDYEKLKPIVLKLIDVCDMINQIGKEPSVNIETPAPCLS